MHLISNIEEKGEHIYLEEQAEKSVATLGKAVNGWGGEWLMID